VRHVCRHGDTHPPLGRRTAAHVHAAAARARVVVVEPHMRAVHLGVGVLACKGGDWARGGGGASGCEWQWGAVRGLLSGGKAAATGCNGLLGLHGVGQAWKGL
jgi:hypothetical protein